MAVRIWMPLLTTALLFGCTRPSAPPPDLSRLQRDLLAAQTQLSQVELRDGFRQAPQVVRLRNNLKESFRADQRKLTANQSNVVAIASDLLDVYIKLGLQYASSGRTQNQYDVLTNVQSSTVQALAYAHRNLNGQATR